MAASADVDCAGSYFFVCVKLQIQPKKAAVCGRRQCRVVRSLRQGGADKRHRIAAFGARNVVLTLQLNGKHGYAGACAPTYCMYCPRNSVCMGSQEPACPLCHWS